MFIKSKEEFLKYLHNPNLDCGRVLYTHYVDNTPENKMDYDTFTVMFRMYVIRYVRFMPNLLANCIEKAFEELKIKFKV